MRALQLTLLLIFGGAVAVSGQPVSTEARLIRLKAWAPALGQWTSVLTRWSFGSN